MRVITEGYLELADEVKQKKLIRQLKYQKKNPEKSRLKSKNWYHRTKNKFWSQILEHYNPKCNCCGETIVEFLQLDHVNNNGSQHRKSIVGHHTLKTYQDCVERGFPDDYQILCANCNLVGKNQCGGFTLRVCPHRRQNEAR